MRHVNSRPQGSEHSSPRSVEEKRGEKRERREREKRERERVKRERKERERERKRKERKRRENLGGNYPSYVLFKHFSHHTTQHGTHFSMFALLT